MRICFPMGLIPLAVVSLAQAQPAPEQPPVDRTCAVDRDCGSEETCLEGRCAAKAPAPVSATSAFFDSLVLGLGLGAFGELWPYSSVTVPGGSRRQLSVIGGVRFWLGWHLPRRVRLMGLIQIGYASAGGGFAEASRGVMEGAGAEVALEYFTRLKPFVRFTYNALVFPISTSPEGTLANSAFAVALGARLSFFELNLSIGRDFAGGVSPGIGLGVAWIY